MTFGWEAQIRLDPPSNWSKIEKVRKKFIMKTFSNLLEDQVKIELPSKSSPYKGPIRIVLAAILAREINSLRAGVC